MEIALPLWDALSLRITDVPAGVNPYATSRLQRGLLLLNGADELAEEAVGFGFPVIKRGLETIFPGGVTLDVSGRDSVWQLRARFQLNLVEKISRPGHQNVESPLLYAAKNRLAGAIRRWPAARGPLTTASSRLRHIFNWETAYAQTDFTSEVSIRYTLEPAAGKIIMDVNTESLPPEITEVVLMNEQGAHYFDRYNDSTSLHLEGAQIGCWDEVHAAQAWFESNIQRVAFGLDRISGARFFRGRELVGSRLAWAGFGYSFPPSIKRFHHELTIARLA